MIEQGKELKFDNVLSLRKKMSQNDMNNEMKKINKLLLDNGLKRNGPVITATFGLEKNNDGHVCIDVEILIPLDKEISVLEPYVFKKLFHLKNAVYSRHEGNPQQLQNTLDEMVKYIQKENLQQITPAYNVTIQEPKAGEGMDKFVIDAYIGVNPSVL